MDYFDIIDKNNRANALILGRNSKGVNLEIKKTTLKIKYNL